MNLTKRRLSISSISAFMLLSLMTTMVFASDIYCYPTDTPKTTFHPTKFDPPYTTCTVDVTPKYYQIPPVEVDWTVVVTYKVTESGAGHVNEAFLRMHEMKDWTHDLSGGCSISTPQGGTITGPTSSGGANPKWDLTVKKETGYYSEGDVIILTFLITTPASLAYDTYTLTKIYHQSMGDYGGQESTSSHAIFVQFIVGNTFEIPEFPLGTLGMFVPLGLAFALAVAFKKYKNIKQFAF